MPNHVDFHYNYQPGDTWASGRISVGSSKFAFVCSYLFDDPLEELLLAVYQIAPNLASFPRSEIEFLMLDEPVEYRWNFRMMVEKNVAVNIYQENDGHRRELIFEENCHLDDVLKALIRCLSRNKELRSNESIEQIYEAFKHYLTLP